MLANREVGAPHELGPPPIRDTAPLRIGYQAHASKLEKLHPIPQGAAEPRCVATKGPQLGGSIQCHGDAADRAEPFFGTAKSPITGGLEGSVYTP